MQCAKYVEREHRQCVRPAVWSVITPDGEVACCQHHAWYYRDLFGAVNMAKLIRGYGFVTMLRDGEQRPSLPPDFLRNPAKRWPFTGNNNLGRFL